MREELHRLEGERGRGAKDETARRFPQRSNRENVKDCGVYPSNKAQHVFIHLRKKSTMGVN